MRKMATVLALVVMALGAITAETASAHGRGHSHLSVGVGFGFGGYWPGYWGGWPGWGYAPYYSYPAAPYYYYPPVVTTAPEPATYIERGDAQPAAANAPRRDWWYYCPETQTYYPYVKQCAGGWQRVEPRPQGEPATPDR